LMRLAPARRLRTGVVPAELIYAHLGRSSPPVPVMEEREAAVP
jgi:hypothetical protein